MRRIKVRGSKMRFFAGPSPNGVVTGSGRKQFCKKKIQIFKQDADKKSIN